MTDLRDQFAMAALTGIIAHPDEDAGYMPIARSAYKFADAMIEARAPAREPTVDNLDLSVRAANFLQMAGITTIAELKKLSREKLRARGCTAKTAKEIFAELERSEIKK